MVIIVVRYRKADSSGCKDMGAVSSGNEAYFTWIKGKRWDFLGKDYLLPCF